MRPKARRGLPGILFALAVMLLSLSAAGCGEDAGQPNEPALPAVQATAVPTLDPLAQAAAEATAIVQQAQATAMVLQAEELAAQTIERAAGAETAGNDGDHAHDDEVSPGVDSAADVATPEPTTLSDSSGSTAPVETSVKVIGVGFAGEGGYIHVQFLASPGVVKRWNQGLVSVTDEETGIEYIEIPVMPKVGPLIGKPVREGQPGFVMLVNGPVPLPAGATVTVKLGNYIEEGITVRG